jgi:hypothetical protein
MLLRKTPAAADELGWTYHQLISLIRFRHMDPPARDSSGDYVWTDDDLRRAREARHARQRRRERKEATCA